MAESVAQQTWPDQLVELMRRHAVDVAIDVGANEGQWAEAVRAAGFAGPIFSFEPASTPFATLVRSAEDDPHWSVAQLALGREEGSLLLQHTENSVFSSVLAPTRYARSLFPQGIAVVGEEEVPVQRLDHVIPRLPGYRRSWRILLKIDVQGLDLVVFEGAAGILDQVQLLQSECSVRPLYEDSPDWLEALSTYRAAGFEPAGFHPVVEAQPYGSWCEFDCILSRHGRVPSSTARPVERPVSVIVTACDDSEPLRALLGTLRGQVDALQGEIVLVVNGAEDVLDPSAGLELEKRCDQLVFEPRVGKSHALNTAIALCRGAVVAFTDDDARPRQEWLSALTAPLLSSDRPPELVGCGGPVVPLFSEAETPGWFREMVLGRTSHFLGPRHDLGSDTRDYDAAVSSEAPLGANCAYRREVFDVYHYEPGLGPNRATGLRGGEDFLLARMLLRDGYTIRYVPQAAVEHAVHADRTSAAYVLRGHYLQGVESVRVSRALGQWSKLGRRAAQRKLAKLRVKRISRWLLGGFRLTELDRITLRARIAHQKGKLREIRRPGARV